MKDEIRITLAPEDAARFNEAAEIAGGRPALVRRFLNSLEDLTHNAPATTQLKGQTLGKVLVRLPAEDYLRLEAEAKHMGLRKGPWVTGLVRARLRNIPTLGRPADLALIAAQAELRRIALSLRNLARQTPPRAGMDPDDLERLAAEVRTALSDLREALNGYARYWGIAP